MKIRIERKALTEALAWVAQAVPKNAPAPALAGIRLTAADGHLTMSAFDYDRGHTATVPAEIMDDGEVLVSGRYLVMVVAGLRGSDVELVFDGHLTVKSGRSTYQLQPMAIGDYPTMPTFGGRVGVIGADALQRIVATAAGPVDDDSPHEQTRGIHLETGEHANAEQLWAVGIDGGGRSIHAASSDWAQDAGLDADVPSTSLVAAVKGLAGAVEIGHDDGTLSLHDDTHTVTLRTYAAVKGRGNWRRVVDKAGDSIVATATTSAKELRAALTRAAAFGNDGRESYVGLVIERDAISVRAQADALGGEDVLDGELDTDDAAWCGINAGLLGLALGALGDAQVGIGLATTGEVPSNTPLYLWPLGRDDVQLVVLPRTWMGETPR